MKNWGCWFNYHSGGILQTIGSKIYVVSGFICFFFSKGVITVTLKGSNYIHTKRAYLLSYQKVLITVTLKSPYYCHTKRNILLSH